MQRLDFNSEIPVVDFGGSGPILLFSHANGYPPGVYRELLTGFLPHYRVLAIEHRPLWQDDPSSLKSWEEFGDDVTDLLDEIGEPVHGLGHSMGGSTLLLASRRRPHAFASLGLMEPVLLPTAWQFGLRQVSKFFPHRVPLIQRALNRVDRWRSREHAFEHYRPKAVFRGFTDTALWDLIDYSTIAHPDGGIALRFTKEWEARCYALVENVWPCLKKLEVPLLGLRGANSNTLAPREWERWKSLKPGAIFHEIESTGHLLPLEAPEAIASLYLDWQKSLADGSL